MKNNHKKLGVFSLNQCVKPLFLEDDIVIITNNI